MPKQFEGLGITLLYPDSWTLSEENAESANRGMILESPGGSFLSINVYDTDADPADVVTEAASAMESEYEDIESEPYEMTLADTDLQGIVQRFYYLDFVIVSKIFGWQRGTSVYLIQIQGEDRDVEEQERVFDAILTSMFRSTAQQ